jgi:hypothetical protein
LQGRFESKTRTARTAFSSKSSVLQKQHEQFRRWTSSHAGCSLFAKRKIVFQLATRVKNIVGTMMWWIYWGKQSGPKKTRCQNDPSILFFFSIMRFARLTGIILFVLFLFIGIGLLFLLHTLSKLLVSLCGCPLYNSLYSASHLLWIRSRGLGL